MDCFVGNIMDTQFFRGDKIKDQIQKLISILLTLFITFIAYSQEMKEVTPHTILSFGSVSRAEFSPDGDLLIGYGTGSIVI